LVRCLEYVNQKGYKSVAFPVIGTGNLGYPWKLVAKTMLDTVEDFGRKHPTSIKAVKIVVFHKDVQSLQVSIEKRPARQLVLIFSSPGRRP